MIQKIDKHTKNMKITLNYYMIIKDEYKIQEAETVTNRYGGLFS